MKVPVPDLCAEIAALAAKHRLGTVGLTGSFARGDAHPGADIDVIVTVSVLAAERFGTTLADVTERAVHLHAFESLPWHHPYHLCVRWLNCRRLPIKLAPRGATVTSLQLHGGTRTVCRIPVERIPHFVPVPGVPENSKQPGSRIIAAPPLGGFLL
jgi:predicted nucleotidyltransferase